MTRLNVYFVLSILLFTSQAFAQGLDPMRDPAFDPNLTRVGGQYLDSRAMYHYLNSLQVQEVVVVGVRTKNKELMSIGDAINRGLLGSPEFDVYISTDKANGGNASSPEPENEASEDDEERMKCISDVKQIGTQCEKQYGVWWRAGCVMTGGLIGRLGYVRLPSEFKFTYTLGATATVGTSCAEFVSQAKQWCRHQVKEKIERDCN